MPRRIRTYKAILKEVARGSERSPLFWWLVEHHDEIVAEADGKRMRWEPLCARFAAHGLTDVTGRPPAPRTARETWLQARRTVAQARERNRQADAAARPGQTMPSRISPDWRPQIVPPPPIRYQAAQGAVPALVERAGAPQLSTEVEARVRAAKADALADLDEMDRKAFGIWK